MNVDIVTEEKSAVLDNGQVSSNGTTAKKAKVLLLGKLPPPYMGPSVAMQILLGSKLNEKYELSFVNNNVHKTLATLGTWSLKKVWKNLGIYANFVRALRTEKPDLVLAPISQDALGFAKDSIFILLNRVFGRALVVQLRGSQFKNWYDGASGPVRAYVRMVLGMARGAIVLGENLRYLFADHFPEDRIFVVPNGADYTIPERKERRDGPVRVLYLANLMRSKGIEDVLQAAYLLEREGGVDFVLDVVGAWADGETEARCKAFLAKHHVPVTIHPPATDTRKFLYFSNADIFVFTPRNPEGHPWVIVEALASGLPIISTDQGAIIESVLDGVNGYIVDKKAPEQIAARLKELIASPEKRRAMGAASREHYLNHFTEQKMVERFSAAFDALMAV